MHDSLESNSSKLPNANMDAYKDGTFKSFWYGHMLHLSSWTAWKGSTPLDDARYGKAKKYMGWQTYGDVENAYANSASFVNLVGAATYTLSPKEKLWTKEDGKYNNALDCYDSTEYLKLVLKGNSKSMLDGKGGIAAYKSGASGSAGCLKISFAPGYPE